MSKVLLHFRKWQRLTNQYIQALNPKLDHIIDKYKLIKCGCILGAAINTYLIYDGIMTVIALKNVKHQVDVKKDTFYRRVENKKEQVFALMQELEQEKLLVGLEENVGEDLML